MPYGRWPDRVKDFRKWANQKVDKGRITDSATGSSKRFRIRKRKRRRRRRMKEE